jgi:hypothetical protein
MNMFRLVVIIMRGFVCRICVQDMTSELMGVIEVKIRWRRKLIIYTFSGHQRTNVGSGHLDTLGVLTKSKEPYGFLKPCVLSHT